MNACLVLTDRFRRSAKEYDGVQSHVGVCNVLLGCRYAHALTNPVRVTLCDGWVTVECCGVQQLATRYVDADGLEVMWHDVAMVEPWLMALASAGWLGRGSRGPKAPCQGRERSERGRSPLSVAPKAARLG